MAIFAIVVLSYIQKISIVIDFLFKSNKIYGYE